MLQFLIRRLLAAFALLAGSCTLAQERTVELLIMPSAFVVDGTSFELASEAVAAAAAKQPDHISLPACAAMPTQRIIDVMTLLRGNFSGRLSMSVLGEGERGCPRFGQSSS